MTSDRLLPANIVARRLSISCSTVYRLINAGELEAINVGAGLKPQWRVKEGSVNAFLERKNNLLEY